MYKGDFRRSRECKNSSPPSYSLLPALRNVYGGATKLIYVVFSFPALALAQRAAIAFRAISRRRSGESFAARIFPPFAPPILPSATACGFFCFLAMPVTTLFAIPSQNQCVTLGLDLYLGV